MDKIENEKSFPLSAAQLALWLDLQLHPNDVSYGIWDYVDLKGPVDESVLIAAIQYVVKGNTALQLQFSGDAMSPRQTIKPLIAAEVLILDFSAEADPAAAAQNWMSANHEIPFNLTAGYLFRNALLRLSSDSYYWYRNYHHIIVDGFGMHLLGAWVAERYTALISGNATERSYTSYEAYLESEAEYRGSSKYEEDKSYWSNLYSEAPEPVSLSMRAPRARGRREFRTSSQWLPRELLDAYYELAPKLGVSLGHLFIASMALYVQKATGAKDVPLAIPVHGRDKTTAQLAGMCVNTLPMRFHIDPQNSIADLVKGLSAALTQGLSHSRYRYEELKRDLGLKHGEATPFRINANVLRSVDAWVFAGCVSHVQTMCAGPVDDLSILIIENRTKRSHFRIAIVSSAMLYEGWEIDKHKLYFQRFLECLATDTSARLADLRLTTTEERQQFLSAGKPERSDRQQFKTFHEMFTHQVAATPDALAICFEKQSLTYAELNAKANQLAHHLRELGAGPEIIVGLCIDRSIEMIVGVLSVLKAGAAYVPIDPDLPRERINFIVKDTQTKVIVTQAAHELVLPDHLAELIFIDVGWDEIAKRPKSDPQTKVQPHNLAYVIYTSGSTGQPKGVLVQHDGLCNLALAQADIFALQPGTRILQFSRLSFDVSMSDIPMAFVGGGTLVMASQLALMPGNLGKTLIETRADLITVPPSVLPTLNSEEQSFLKTVSVIGEACPVEIAREWSQQRRFFNTYGPTEATVFVTWTEFKGGDVLSIGRAIPNIEIYILDEYLEPVPVGVVGELYIGGIGVARGYLNRPELMAEKFIAHPFKHQEGTRVYRSGDLARFLPDGDIEFRGRVDQQVKLRGFRIELGEIETALLSHPDLTECAVVVRENGKRKQLIGYAVKRNDSSDLDSRGLRIYLRDRVPDYMIPAVIVFLNALPRTSSGKLNRKVLPVPDTSAQWDRPHIDPRTDTEKKLATIWQQILGLEKVSIQDNFFDIGGDSLMTIQLIASVWDAMQIDLPAQCVYESDSLESLAQQIDALSVVANEGVSAVGGIGF